MSMSNTKFTLSTIVLSLAGSVLIFLAVGMMLADQWQISTERTIDAEPARVEALLTDLNRWVEWSAFDFQLGAPTKRTVLGEPGVVGHRAEWQGPMGTATLALTRVEDDLLEYSIVYQWAQQAGTFGGKLTGSVAWLATGDRCQITWSERGELATLIQRWNNWFGALQEKVRAMQRASLSGLEEALRETETATPK